MMIESSALKFLVEESASKIATETQRHRDKIQIPNLKFQILKFSVPLWLTTVLNRRVASRQQVFGGAGDAVRVAMIAQRQQLAEHAGRATKPCARKGVARFEVRDARFEVRERLVRVEAFDTFFREAALRGARDGERRVVWVRAPKCLARLARRDRVEAPDQRRAPERADLLRGVASVQDERLLDRADARDARDDERDPGVVYEGEVFGNGERQRAQARAQGHRRARHGRAFEQVAA